jgi:metallophosphoesterase (TIGR00282 family)
MKILMLGDIMGRAGRTAVLEQLPTLRKNHKLDVVIANADNASGGFGVTPKHAMALLEAGADVVTCGDHVWDQKDLRSTLADQGRILRPMNYPAKAAGKGIAEWTLTDGRKVVVLHPLGQVFIKDNVDCPFAAVDEALARYRLGATVQAILVDFHAEATSEKCAMGLYLDGRVSVVAGSHTHIPTSDERILPKGTAYQTDMGMCGDYTSVIGFDPEAPMEAFTQKMRKSRMTPAMDEPTISGLFVQTDDRTGLAKRVKAVRIGGVLSASVPE